MQAEANIHEFCMCNVCRDRKLESRIIHRPPPSHITDFLSCPDLTIFFPFLFLFYRDDIPSNTPSMRWLIDLCSRNPMSIESRYINSDSSLLTRDETEFHSPPEPDPGSRSTSRSMLYSIPNYLSTNGHFYSFLPIPVLYFCLFCSKSNMIFEIRFHCRQFLSFIQLMQCNCLVYQ
jgi:hypothetical protein